MVNDRTPDLSSQARVWSVPAHDELHHGGESLVLVDGRVHRVSPIGAAIRERAVDGADVAELAAALEDSFGPPEAGSTLDLTLEAVDALVRAGLLRRSGAAETAHPGA